MNDRRHGPFQNGVYVRTDQGSTGSQETSVPKGPVNTFCRREEDMRERHLRRRKPKDIVSCSVHCTIIK